MSARTLGSRQDTAALLAGVERSNVAKLQQMLHRCRGTWRELVGHHHGRHQKTYIGCFYLGMGERIRAG